jgi:hypothetical protein
MAKKGLENRDVQVRFVSADDYSAISRVSAWTGCNGNESGFLEARLNGLTPLGTFRRRSTAHQIEVGWRRRRDSWTLSAGVSTHNKAAKTRVGRLHGRSHIPGASGAAEMWGGENQ